MRILAMDASLASCSVALLVGDRIIVSNAAAADRGHAALLPAMVAAALEEAQLTAGMLDAIAAVVGPGRFTGLRVALALAEGIATAAGLPGLGVTTGEALVAGMPSALRADREAWSVIDNRRGRVVLERFAIGAITPSVPARAMALEALPPPPPRLSLVGDAAPQVLSLLAARADVTLAEGVHQPSAAAAARVAAWRLAGSIPPLSLAPLYVEAPAVRLPA